MTDRSVGKSSSAIAAMELKYPDNEEKKNSVCIPFDTPQTSGDYFLAAHSQNNVEALVTKELGMIWMRSRRCYNQYHLSVRQMVSFLWLVLTRGEAVKEKYEMCIKQIQNYSDSLKTTGSGRRSDC